MDIVGGILLADGSECKMVTGIDDHSGFMVIAKVVQRATARAICLAFGEALVRFGVPGEGLTGNGKQFTARFSPGKPGETMFDRICRENGITHRLTRPQSPTTTGKIERFHQTLRRELLDRCDPFVDLATVQSVVDAWLEDYNRMRPHQALDMAVPASRFVPRPRSEPDVLPAVLPARLDPVPDPAAPEPPPEPVAAVWPMAEGEVGAIEVERVSRVGEPEPARAADLVRPGVGRHHGDVADRREPAARPDRRWSAQDAAFEAVRPGPQSPAGRRGCPSCRPLGGRSRPGQGHQRGGGGGPDRECGWLRRLGR